MGLMVPTLISTTGNIDITEARVLRGVKFNSVNASKRQRRLDFHKKEAQPVAMTEILYIYALAPILGLPSRQVTVYPSADVTSVMEFTPH